MRMEGEISKLRLNLHKQQSSPLSNSVRNQVSQRSINDKVAEMPKRLQEGQVKMTGYSINYHIP